MRAGPKPQRSVLVVDNDEGCRTLMRTVLELGAHSVLEAATGEEALGLAAHEPPGLVVLEVCLPGICGYQVCRVLRERFGDGLPIVFVSGARTERYARVAALLLGGDDYLEKPFAPDELLIRVDRLLRRSNPVAATVVAQLTPREREVLRLVGEGFSAREIAERLCVSPKTVGTHCENVLRKLGVRTRAHAVALAVSAGVFAPRDGTQASPHTVEPVVGRNRAGELELDERLGDLGRG